MPTSENGSRSLHISVCFPDDEGAPTLRERITQRMEQAEEMVIEEVDNIEEMSFQDLVISLDLAGRLVDEQRAQIADLQAQVGQLGVENEHFRKLYAERRKDASDLRATVNHLANTLGDICNVLDRV